MMTRCANCESPLLREKEVRKLQKISWLNWEFECPHCGVRLSTSCVWHEVLQVAVIVTIVVQMIFVLFLLVGSETAENIIWAELAITLTLILILVVSALKTRTRVLKA